MRMPEYATTLLLLFILVTCFYNRHIRDWRWFRGGAAAFGSAVALGAIWESSRQWGFPPVLGAWQHGLFQLMYSAGLITAGVGFVIASTRECRGTAQELRCLKCGYILKGLSQPRCPECGQAI